MLVNTARTRAFALIAAFALLAALGAPYSGRAQDQPPLEEGNLAEVPSFGGARPGPILPIFAGVPRGIAPVQLLIDGIGLEAPIERGLILDGVMQDPSGPWVVTWYDELSELGQDTNVIMAGHVDYWDVGPAIFAGVPGLVEGDVIRVVGEDGEVFEYQVEWNRLYNVAQDLTPEVIQTEIVGDTGRESLTLITCGGEFNYDTGEYVSRVIVRATKI